MSTNIWIIQNLFMDILTRRIRSREDSNDIVACLSVLGGLSSVAYG
jgi:hypothetical protein